METLSNLAFGLGVASALVGAGADVLALSDDDAAPEAAASLFLTGGAPEPRYAGLGTAWPAAPATLALDARGRDRRSRRRRTRACGRWRPRAGLRRR